MEMSFKLHAPTYLPWETATYTGRTGHKARLNAVAKREKNYLLRRSCSP